MNHDFPHGGSVSRVSHAAVLYGHGCACERETAAIYSSSLSAALPGAPAASPFRSSGQHVDTQQKRSENMERQL